MATRLAGPTLSKVREIASAFTLVSSARILTVNGACRLGATLSLLVGGAPGTRSVTSSALTRYWRACALKENGSTTFDPASIPSMVQPRTTFSTQLASAGPALLSTLRTLAAVTLPPLPTSTATWTIPAMSRRSASAFAKQRCTSAPCVCKAFSTACATRWASPDCDFGCALADPMVAIAQHSVPPTTTTGVIEILVGFLTAPS